MDNPSETRLDTSEDDWSLLGVSLDEVGISYAGPVGTSVVDSAGGEVIILTELSRRGVVGDHGVHRTCGNTPEQVGNAEAHDVALILYRWLSDDTHLETVLHQPMSDDGGPVVG